MFSFLLGNIRDKAGLESVFAEHKMSFAGLKAVGESIETPFEY